MKGNIVYQLHLMDWHENSDGIKVCVIEDDASRKILAGGEFKHSYEKNSIQVFEELVEKYWDKIGMLKEPYNLIMVLVSGLIG